MAISHPTFSTYLLALRLLRHKTKLTLWFKAEDLTPAKFSFVPFRVCRCAGLVVALSACPVFSESALLLILPDKCAVNLGKFERFVAILLI